MSNARDLADLADDATTVPTTGAPNPNLIINGGFTVNQRTYVSTTATADGTYMHDRWRSGTANSSYLFSTASPASPQTVTIAANDSIEQVIEGSTVGTAGTHTISWTGTATARGVVNTQTMSGNFAVSPITVTAVLDQVITLQFTGADAAGGSTIATDTGTLGKVKCELGTSATAFVHESYGETLAKCQRYYWHTNLLQGTRLFGAVYDATNTQGHRTTFPVEMRGTTGPTASFTSSVFRAAAKGTVHDSTITMNITTDQWGFQANINPMSAGTRGEGMHIIDNGGTTTTGDIQFDAEL